MGWKAFEGCGAEVLAHVDQAAARLLVGYFRIAIFIPVCLEKEFPYNSP